MGSARRGCVELRPVVHLGVDIGVKRDTSAVAGVYRHEGQFRLFCHRIWEPPVQIPEVTSYLVNLLERERVGGVWYDPSQFLSEVQRLSERYGRLLREVNQSGSFMVTIATNLHSMCQRGDFLLYPDPRLLSHFVTAAAKVTEAGPRIVKSQQSRPIDALIATAMALYGASTEDGHAVHYFQADTHLVSVEDLL